MSNSINYWNRKSTETGVLLHRKMIFETLPKAFLFPLPPRSHMPNISTAFRHKQLSETTATVEKLISFTIMSVLPPSSSLTCCDCSHFILSPRHQFYASSVHVRSNNDGGILSLMRGQQWIRRASALSAAATNQIGMKLTQTINRLQVDAYRQRTTTNE